MLTKFFDININNVLKDWEVHHAIRELISNALDEHTLNEVDELPSFTFSNNSIIISDKGRGLRESHLVMNENSEKNDNSKIVIGKFGMGLKDAIAVLYRNKKKITIESKYLYISGVECKEKNDFGDIKTLHLHVGAPRNKEFLGTKIIISGILLNEYQASKKLFVNYSNLDLICETDYGNIYRKENQKHSSIIYIHGVEMTTSNLFTYHYNITNTPSKLKKEINRDRKSLGLTSYTDQIKNILTRAIRENKEVRDTFLEQLNSSSKGKREITWKDIKERVEEYDEERKKKINEIKKTKKYKKFLTLIEQDYENENEEVIEIIRKDLDKIGKDKSLKKMATLIYRYMKDEDDEEINKEDKRDEDDEDKEEEEEDDEDGEDDEEEEYEEEEEEEENTNNKISISNQKKEINSRPKINISNKSKTIKIKRVKK